MIPPIKGMPLYLQVRNEILRRISSGRLRIGSWLPNESELSQELSVSVGTIRRAMEMLETDHVIRREQGRGTRVLDPAAPISTLMFNNLRDQQGARVEGTLTRIRLEIQAANVLERLRLKLNPNDRIIKEVRTRSHEGVVQMLEESSIAISRLPGLTELPVGDYRIAPLAFEYGVLLGRAVEDISVSPLDGEIAERLGVKAGLFGLKLDRIIYSKDDEPIQWRIAYALLTSVRYVAETWVGSASSLVSDFLADKRETRAN